MKFQVHREDPYRIRLISELEKYGIASVDDLIRLPELPRADQDALLGHLGELAFSCQHVSNLLLGSEALLKVEKKWLLMRLDAFLESFLATDDYWEYAQIACFLGQFDEDARMRFLRKCGEHPNPEIREISQQE